MNMEEQKRPDKIQAFDALFSTNQIQICKLLLSYLEPSMQKSLAIYIKYMEFRYTLSYLQKHPKALLPTEPKTDTDRICSEILPFCSPGQKKQVEQFAGMFSNLKNVTEMMETVNMMKEMFPEGFSFGDMENGDGSMPDMAQLFQMFGGSV